MSNAHAAFPFQCVALLRLAPRILGLSLLTACASDLPVAEPSVAGLFENACLPEAIMMSESLRKANIEARILIIHAADWSHAATVYVYPRDNPKVWVWDASSKSRTVKASYDNPLQIARAWLDDQYSDKPVLRAEFL